MSQNHHYQITLRGLSAEFLKEIKQEARRLGVSLSEAILKRLFPIGKKKPSCGDCASLLKLAGTWSKPQSNQFNQSLGELRQIDAKEWTT